MSKEINPELPEEKDIPPEIQSEIEFKQTLRQVRRDKGNAKAAKMIREEFPIITQFICNS